MTRLATARAVTLSVPCMPLGANQVSGHDERSFRRVKAQIVKDTGNLWVAAGRPTFRHAVIDIAVIFPTGRRRDPANYHGSGSAKWIIDALTRCGAWPDDSPEYVTIRRTTTEYRPGLSGAVELTITEAT